MNCVICGNEIQDKGRKPWPVIPTEGKHCCLQCFCEIVAPVRMRTFWQRKECNTEEAYHNALLQQKKVLQDDLRAIDKAIELWDKGHFFLLSKEDVEIMNEREEEEQ